MGTGEGLSLPLPVSPRPLFPFTPLSFNDDTLLTGLLIPDSSTPLPNKLGVILLGRLIDDPARAPAPLAPVAFPVSAAATPPDVYIPERSYRGNDMLVPYSSPDPVPLPNADNEEVDDELE